MKNVVVACCLVGAGVALILETPVYAGWWLITAAAVLLISEWMK